MTKTLRLLYPQWQGAHPTNIMHYLDDKFDEKTSILGYNLGSQIVNLIVPKSNDANDCTAEVPISKEYIANDLKVENSIHAYQTIKKHLSSALSILKEKDPQRVIVIGGECSVSLAPFKYMINKYGSDNVAMIWIDAHPDLTLPGDPGENAIAFHEMPVSHILNLKGCDEGIMKMMPENGNLKLKNHLYLGLRASSEAAANRIKEFNLEKLTPEEFRAHPDKLNEFIKKSGCSKVIVHLDLDVLEPSDLYCAVGKDANGMLVKELVDSMNRISSSAEVVALTIAEHMPLIQIKMREMFNEFSIFK